MLKQLIGDRLRLARLLKGCSLQEVGGAVSVSRQSIHQYESDNAMPSEDILNALAEFLGVNTEFFYKPMIGDVKPEQCHFRKRMTTPAIVKNRVQAYSTILEQLVEKLHDYLELPANSFDLLELDKIPDLTAPVIEKIAEGARKRWGLPIDAPIDDMVDVAENSGAIVTYFSGVSDKVDALSINRKFPIIIRNTAKESICRMRFDLAHECGHLIMHNGIETGCKKTEREADAFASAFLFPRTAFAREFPKCLGSRGIIWPEIYKLKNRWKVSARAIIYRAHFLGFISAQEYRSANIYFSQTRQTRKERGDELIQEEIPHILESSIELLGSELGITFEMLSDELGVKPSLLAEISGIKYEAVELDQSFDSVVVPFKF